MIVTIDFMDFRKFRENMKSVEGYYPQTYYTEDSEGFDMRFKLMGVEHRTIVQKKYVGRILTLMNIEGLHVPENFKISLEVSPGMIFDFKKRELETYQKVNSFPIS